MTTHSRPSRSQAGRLTLLLLASLVAGVVAAIALLGVPQRDNSARASTPTALELADHLLTAPLAVEDEGPYRLIDPVGPGGLTQQAAISEVTASTMQGGSYGDHQYYGQYGEQIYLPPAPAPNGGYVHPHGWGGHRR